MSSPQGTPVENGPAERRGVIRRAGRMIGGEMAHLVGINGIVGWAGVIRRNLLQARRICPACQAGRLFKFSGEVEGGSRDFYGCSQCAHFEVADLSDADDPYTAETLSRLAAIASSKLDGIPKQEREVRLSGMRLRSRAYLAAAVLLLLGGGFALVVDGPAWTILNCGALSFLLLAHALRWSYRHWQIVEGAVFQPESFRRWIKAGRWIV